MTTAPGAAALAAMSAEDFAEVVKEAIPRSTPPAVWDALTDPAVIDRTRECLVAARVDVQHQLGVARSAAEEARAGAIANGEEGKEAFYAAKNADAEWRRRAMGFLRLVDQRIALVKSRIPRPPQQPPGAALSRVQYRNALERLARAVAVHRDKVLSGEGGEGDDDTLWDSLDQITVPDGNGGEQPLAKWLGFLDQVRDA